MRDVCTAKQGRSILVIAIVAVCAIASVSAQQPYNILDHWKIGGTGSWDYLTVDSAAHLLYLAHGPRVEVVDARVGKLVTSITGFKGIHGIALDDHAKFGYISDGSGNSVAVFDRHSFAVVATIPAGTNPDATWNLNDCDSPSGLVLDAVHRQLFTECDGKKMAVVDAGTGQQLASPDAARVSASRQLAFSSNGGGTLTVVDTAHAFKVLETLATAPGGRTMAYDEASDRIFVAAASLGPTPPATTQIPRPRPSIVPDSYEAIAIGRP